MSLLYKRHNSQYWYVTRTRVSTKTNNRRLAEEFARKSLTEAWRADALGEKRRTWAELVDDWADRKEGMASLEQDRTAIDRLSELLQRRGITALSAITGDVIAHYAKTQKAMTSASTANRHLTTLRAMLRRAHAKRWISEMPTIENYRTVKTEVRWLTIDQLNSILPHLPEWVADMLVFGSQTGLRFSNIAQLRWGWINQAGNVVVVPASGTKTKETYTVPLSRIAKEILSKWKARAIKSEFVFVGKKRTSFGVYEDCAPVPTIRHWWEQARAAAGFPDITWHQATRHTWASWHTQNHTPDRILQKMGGWASPRMLETYAHLATEHLTEFADNHNER